VVVCVAGDGKGQCGVAGKRACSEDVALSGCQSQHGLACCNIEDARNAAAVCGDELAGVAAEKLGTAREGVVGDG
jgi:hypothetical protein